MQMRHLAPTTISSYQVLLLDSPGRMNRDGRLTQSLLTLRTSTPYQYIRLIKTEPLTFSDPSLSLSSRAVPSIPFPLPPSELRRAVSQLCARCASYTRPLESSLGRISGLLGLLAEGVG